MSHKEILAAALALTTKQRAALAHKLLRTLDDTDEHESPADIAKAWDKELARRVDDIKSGKAKTIPWPQARAQIERRLRARRRKIARR
jgi:putative addiction module component (TIGR02574 family)